MLGRALISTFRSRRTPIGIAVSKFRLFVLGLAVAYPWAVFAWSSQHGRMAYSLGYDDVSYAMDSASRWRYFLNHSFIEALSNLVSNPPHSPLSTFFGTLGFPFFGISDFGFYFGNSILFYSLVALTYATYSGMRSDFPRWIVDATVLVLICSPIGLYLVHDSRPDMATGYLTILSAVGVFYLKPDSRQGYKNLVALVLGLALLSKPTFIPHTLLLVALAFVFRWVIRDARNGIWVGLKGFFDLACRTLIFSAPLLVLEFKPTLDYVIDNLFAKNKSVWTFPSEMSFVEIVLEYLHPWWMYMGGFITPFSLALAAIVILLFKKRTNPMITLLTVMSTCSLLFIAYLRYMNEYFFSSIHVAAVFALPLTYLQILGWSKGLARKALPLGAALVIIAFGCTVTLFAHYPAFPETKNTERNDRQIARYLKEKNISALFLTFTGPINQDNIGWESEKLGHTVQMTNGTFESDIDKIVAQAQQYDSVLVPNLLTSSFNQDMPSGPKQGAVISKLLEAGYGYNPDFQKLGTRYYLLQRGSQASGPVIVSVEGLGQIAFNRLDPAASIESRIATNSEISICIQTKNEKLIHVRLVSANGSSGFAAELESDLPLQSRLQGGAQLIDQHLRIAGGRSCIRVVPLKDSEMIQLKTGPNASKID
jgi:hypothetical protein